ncbi:hypothetical protein ACIBQX_24655 [Nonomuraea sp. NPDC049714]|uniref:hypothetical protein n=1 Tax=Nonomuraea sp. NPDC049714 TaxID=3364357 RepID=UPI0037AF36E3
MAENWKPIKLYVYLGSVTPPQGTSRETVLEYLNSADPDAIERAGRSYVEAAKLVQGDAGGKGGVQGAVMKAAEDLAAVWRGGDAANALKALRLLHASAGALGQAMKQTGEPLTKYAGEVRRYRTMVADLPPAPLIKPMPTFANGGIDLPGGNGVTAPPVISAYGPNGLTGPVIDSDAQARKRLEELNVVIYDLNSQIADGLAFQMPNITPMEVNTEQAPQLDPGSGTKVPYGTTRYWSDGTGGGPGGDYSDYTGSSGSEDSSGSGRPGDDTPGPGDRPGGQDDDTPGHEQDQGGRDPVDGSDDDPSSTDRPGNGLPQQPEQQQPGENQDGGEREVPAVIGGEDRGTQLADATTTTTPPTTTTTTPANPHTSMPTTAYTPTAQTPFTTTNPFSTPGGPTGGTWYGAGTPASAASPAVLRGGPATAGNGFMGYPPGGMGAGSNEGEERTREYYDPEGDLWSPAQEIGPHTIG